MKARFRAAKPAILAFVPAWVLCAALRLYLITPFSETFTALFAQLSIFYLVGFILSRQFSCGKGAPWTETGAITLLLLADLFVRNGIERLASHFGGSFGSYLADGLETALQRLGYDVGRAQIMRDPQFFLLALLLAAVMAGAFVLGFHWRERLPGDGSEPR